MTHAPILTVIGAGAYGTAIAIALSKHGHKILLWGHNKTHIKTLQTYRCNHTYLPHIPFPPTLYVEESLYIASNACQDLLIAVPSHAFNTILIQLKKLNIKNNIRIIAASKGIEPKTGRLLQDVTSDILGNDVPFAIISGPTFAKEIAIGLPTAITLAANNIIFREHIQKLLHCNKNFRIYINTDIIGIQIAGAIKNIIAIGTGISDGIGFGSNARTALITRGLTEMSRLGIAIGATAEIFTGLAGLGDLVLTCTDNQSRNRRFGILLGQGISVLQAKKKIGQIIEGLSNVRDVYMLAVKNKIDMPITKEIYQILYQNKNIHEAARSLLDRTQKPENQ